MRGVIKMYKSERGFGFIAPDGGGEDIFLHCKDLAEGESEDGLAEGVPVTFATGPGRTSGQLRGVQVRIEAGAPSRLSPAVLAALRESREDIIRAVTSFERLLVQLRGEGADVLPVWQRKQQVPAPTRAGWPAASCATGKPSSASSCACGAGTWCPGTCAAASMSCGLPPGGTS